MIICAKRILKNILIFSVILGVIFGTFSATIAFASDSEKQMLHIAGIEGKDNDAFMIDAALEPNVEYTVEFRYNFIKGSIHNGDGGQMFVDVYNTKSSYGMKRGAILRRSTIKAGAANGFTTKKDSNGKMIYTFTLTNAEDEVAKGNYRIGFYVVNSAVECYIGDLTLYATADTEKTNLLSHKFDRNVMAGCYSDWHAGLNTETEFNGSTSAKYTAKFEVYDATKFMPDEEVYEKQMLHIAGIEGKDNDSFMIDAALEPNVEYTVEFKYNFVKGKIHNGDSGQMFVDVYNTKSSYGMKRGAMLRRSAVALGETQGFTTRTDKNGKMTYTFTITSTEDETAEGKYRLGFYVVNSAVECYIGDLTLYATADTEKTNLLSHKFDRNVMAGCYSDWHAGLNAETEFNGSTSAKYTAKFEEFNENAFLPQQPDDVAKNKQMLYFRNGAGWCAIIQRFYANPGDVYYFEYSLASESTVYVAAFADGARNQFIQNAPQIERTDYEHYYHAKAKIVVPETVKGEPITDQIFVGLNLPANAAGYVFDISIYKANDEEKEEVFANPDFKVGLDNWAFGWQQWFIAGMGGLGKREWVKSDNSSEIRVMDFDEKKIIRYTDDSLFNDGEWWSEEDITIKEEQGKATLSGILKSPNDTGISGKVMMLESESNSFKRVTDRKGNFTFSNIPEDFYELFFIDSNGEKLPTGYSYTLNDGDKVKVTVVMSQEKILEVEEKAVGKIKGGVYTPKAKPIPGIEVTLRDIGTVTTDKNGQFEFNDIPVGEYEIYTVTDEGKEYIFRRVEIKASTELSIKLKYDHTKITGNSGNEDIAADDSGNTLIFVLAGSSIIIVAAGVLGVLLFLKKRKRTVIK